MTGAKDSVHIAGTLESKVNAIKSKQDWRGGAEAVVVALFALLIGYAVSEFSDLSKGFARFEERQRIHLNSDGHTPTTTRVNSIETRVQLLEQSAASRDRAIERMAVSIRESQVRAPERATRRRSSSAGR